jgi:Prealbumin-like fold domain
VAPVGINLQNCGQVIIRKQTIPDENPNTTQFGYTKSFSTDPVSVNTFTLTDDGVKDYGKTVLFGSGYTVTEDVIPANWEFVSLNCSASTGVTPSIVGATVTFDINADTDVLDCTYTNQRLLGAIKITKTRKHAATPANNAHAGVNFTITGGSLPVGGTVVQTNASGVACLGGLAFGDYVVTESVPTGYVSDDAVKEVTVGANSVCGDGNEAPVSFHNTPLTNVTVSVDSQVVGGTASVINCGAGDVPTGAGGDGSTTVMNLQPTAPTVTLTCTVTVDP